MRELNAIRYVTPLREGGSLPAVVEADDDRLYVLKFRGAGQGVKALIAELIGGEIGRTLGFNVPELLFLQVDPLLARSEPNYEIAELIRGSAGLNLGMGYLANALPFNHLLQPPAIGDNEWRTLASSIVWFDSFITNVDRTARNVNMLVWYNELVPRGEEQAKKGDLWLIDHGAALYIHHSWDGYLERATSAFPLIKDHTLLPFAASIADVAPALRAKLTPETIRAIVDMVPAEWLVDEFDSVAEHREAYVSYLLGRLDGAATFEEEAARAHKKFAST